MRLTLTDAELNAEMAVAVSDSAEFAEAGDAFLAKAKQLASKDSVSGKFEKSLSLSRGRGTKGVRDILITSDHPGGLAIEFGHWAGDQTSGTGKHVPGKHTLRRAARSISRPRTGGTA